MPNIATPTTAFAQRIRHSFAAVVTFGAIVARPEFRWPQNERRAILLTAT
jgi:hypothetical protein